MLLRVLLLQWYVRFGAGLLVLLHAVEVVVVGATAGFGAGLQGADSGCW